MDEFPSKIQQRGIALMEALISLAIISIVFVAIANLQARSLLATNMADQRSKATYLTKAMAERVRANLPGYRAHLYDDFTGETPDDPNCLGKRVWNACTVEQMAQTDFFWFRTRLSTVLPGGTGVVCVDSTPDDGTSAAPACDGLASTDNRLAVKTWWDNRQTGIPNRQVLTFVP